MTAKPISRLPTNDAVIGERPRTMWRCTFSTSTIASSTTRPTASTMASSENVFRLYPISAMNARVPISDSGIVTTVTKAPRIEPRNRKMTTITRMTASRSASKTSTTDSLMKIELSKATARVTSVGSTARRPGSSRFTRPATVSAFAEGCLIIPTARPGLPSISTPVFVLSAPTTTSATSDRRTSASFLARSTMFLKPSRLTAEVLAITSIRVPACLIEPTGILALPAISARRTSSLVIE